MVTNYPLKPSSLAWQFLIHTSCLPQVSRGLSSTNCSGIQINGGCTIWDGTSPQSLINTTAIGANTSGGSCVALKCPYPIGQAGVMVLPMVRGLRDWGELMGVPWTTNISISRVQEASLILWNLTGNLIKQRKTSYWYLEMIFMTLTCYALPAKSFWRIATPNFVRRYSHGNNYLDHLFLSPSILRLPLPPGCLVQAATSSLGYWSSLHII